VPEMVVLEVPGIFTTHPIAKQTGERCESEDKVYNLGKTKLPLSLFQISRNKLVTGYCEPDTGLISENYDLKVGVGELNLFLYPNWQVAFE
jgi:hypothetical protein